MPRSKNKTPLINLDEEINIKDYPYYQYIPIKSIAEKQKKLIPVSVVPVSVIPVIHHIDNSQTYAEAVNANIVSEQQCDYAAEIASLEQRSLEINADIQKGLVTLYEQQQQINTNQRTIQEQTVSIDNNTDVINKQLVAFNHNTNAVAYQYNQINDMNIQIHNLNQAIIGLNNEITNKQTELDTTQKQLDDIQNQIAYHGNMLNAFNTMMQNPQYFIQMMSSSHYIYNQDTLYYG